MSAIYYDAGAQNAVTTENQVIKFTMCTITPQSMPALNYHSGSDVVNRRILSVPSLHPIIIVTFIVSAYERSECYLLSLFFCFYGWRRLDLRLFHEICGVSFLAGKRTSKRSAKYFRNSVRLQHVYLNRHLWTSFTKPSLDPQKSQRLDFFSLNFVDFFGNT